MTEDRMASIDERRLNFEIERHARERWWHEDNLINQRTTWLLTTQGVLATAFGFVKYRAAELSFRSPSNTPEFKYDEYVQTLQIFSDGLAAIGIVSSLVSLIGIFAAQKAQRALQRTHGTYLGVASQTTRIGHFVAMFTPILCIAAWLVALAVFRK
jgi:ABC-type multidrug transport system permease subunit